MSVEQEIIDEDIQSYFILNQNLNVNRVDVDDEYYFSYVKDVEDDCFLIDHLSKNGITLKIRPNESLGIVVVKKEALLLCESVVLRIETGRISGLWVQYPEMLKKVQRRESLRWEITFPVEVFLTIEGQEKQYTCESFNVSPEGIAFVTKFPIQINLVKKIRIQFKFLNRNIDSCARIVHSSFNLSKNIHITGCALLDINKATSEEIYKFIVQKQLELRRLELKKKGLI